MRGSPSANDFGVFERHSGERIPEMTAAKPMGKVGRNAPCACGSGKKYKQCCLAREQRVPGVERLLFQPTHTQPKPDRGPPLSEDPAALDALYEDASRGTPAWYWRAAQQCALAGRLIEADYFLGKYLATNSTDVAALRLAALVACERCDSEAAKLRFQSLQEVGAPDPVLWMLEVVFLLTLGAPREAAICAGHMLAAPPLDPYAKTAAWVAALRVRDIGLFCQALAIPGDAPRFTRNEAIAAKDFVRHALIDVLRARTEKRTG